MAEAGKTTAEIRRIVQRRRAQVIARLCSAIEETGLEYDDEERLKALVREAVSALADGICAMLPSVVDETIPVNVLYLELMENMAGSIADAVVERINGSDTRPPGVLRGA